MTKLLNQIESITNTALIQLRKIYNRYDYAKWRTAEYETELDFIADHPDWVPFPSKEELLSHIDNFGTEMDHCLDEASVLEPVVEYLEKALEELKKYGDILTNSEDKTNE